MKKLIKIVIHGSYYKKGYPYPGFIMAHFLDGSTKYMGDISHNEAVAKLRGEFDTADYEAAANRWVKTGQPQTV